LFKKKLIETNLLKVEIDRLTLELSGLNPESKEYAQTVEQLAVLHKLWLSERKQPLFSPDALLAAATNLFGIGLIMSHERLNVITTKALGFVTKPTLKAGPTIK
jgi:hypothetical protein